MRIPHSVIFSRNTNDTPFISPRGKKGNKQFLWTTNNNESSFLNLELEESLIKDDAHLREKERAVHLPVGLLHL